MKVLYIIGNGFDLWHGLPTSYGEFYSRASETLSQFEEYFVQYDDCSIPWSDFENNLGDYDWQTLFQEQELPDVSSDDFRPSYVYGLEDGIREQTENMVNDITAEFESWVSSIDIKRAEAKILFEPKSLFLSFNYTSTLEIVYRVDSARIKHIHGNVDNHEQIIFGHGESITVESEIDENGDSNCSMFFDAESAARMPLHSFKKPVDDLLDRNSEWIGSLGDIDTFVVLGHSLNRVDLPYFHKLVELNPSANWVVSCYSQSDYQAHRETLTQIDIPTENIHTCSLEDIQTTVHDLNKSVVVID